MIKGLAARQRLAAELKKPYYDVDYLERFDDIPKKQSVSAVIATYNRAPYNPKTEKGRFNPLHWCLESLLRQKPSLNEIVVVDDNSTDFTRAVVKGFKSRMSKKKVRLRHVRSKERLGSARARNLGVKKAESDFVFFADDDCIESPYSIFGPAFIYRKLQEDGLKVGAVQMPVYTRYMLPTDIAERNEIGRVNFRTAEINTPATFFPAEYLAQDGFFLDRRYKILKPIQVQKITGVFLASRKLFRLVGGFPNYFTWPNNYGDDMECGLRFLENGFSLFFTPDPKFRVVHARFGSPANVKVSLREQSRFFSHKILPDLNFKEMLAESKKPRLNTGNRVTDEEWYYSKVIFYFVILYERNRKGALEWAKRSYIKFVKENQKSFSRYLTKGIPEENKREEIWYRAIIDGLKLLSQTEKFGQLDFLQKVNDMMRNEEEAPGKMKDVLKMFARQTKA